MSRRGARTVKVEQQRPAPIAAAVARTFGRRLPVIELCALYLGGRRTAYTVRKR